MTAESDENMFDTPSFMFVGSKEEYQDLKSKNKEQTPKSDNHTIRKACNYSDCWCISYLWRI